jgi:hypothetical protein
MLRILIIIASFAICAVATPIKAADDDAILYKVKRGDTLIGLGEKYFTRSDDYKKIQRANGLTNANIIPVGKQLRISRSYLKFKASTATLVAVRGNVTLVRSGVQSAAATGTSFGEGVLVRTASSSFTTLSLENGSRISLPSNSDLKILRLRRYLIDSSLDYDFEVGRGGAKSKVTPLTNGNDRYVVKTPKAVSAVRGTDFQARYDDQTGSDFSEVTEGALAVDLPGGESSLMPAGNGLAVKADGGVIKEALLAPMELTGAGRIQNKNNVTFDLPEDSGIAGMRITIGSDAGFVEQIADGKFNGKQATFEGIEDGNYFARFRAISENGIEGMPATYTFKRRLNTVAASAGASDLGYIFKWLAEGKGIQRFHFQLYQGKAEGVAIVDEAGLTEQQISLSDLPIGDYYWRVASVQYLDGEVSTNWTPFEKLTVSADQ